MTQTEKKQKAAIRQAPTVLQKRFSVKHLFKLFYFLLLLLIVNGSYVLAFFLRYGYTFINFDQRNFSAYIISVPILSIAALILADALKMTLFYRRTKVQMVQVALKFSVLQTLATTTTAFYMRAFSFPRGILALGFVFILILTSFWGFTGIWISRKLYVKGKLVVIGKDKHELIGIIDKVHHHLYTYHSSILGSCLINDKKQVYQMIDQATEVMLSASLSDQEKSELLLYAVDHNKVIYLVPDFFDMAIWGTSMVQFSDVAMFMVDRLDLTFEQRLFKRLFDIALSFLALLLTWPIMLGICCAIKLTSPGPVLYKQERMTIHNRIYHILKFRSMIYDAEKETGPVISGKEDPRITKVGAFLRKTKLDELPQFFNVLKGDMSLVGPRSEREYFIRRYSEIIPGYKNRFRVKAGITGYAQISGKYDTSANDKLIYDLAYIKNYSLLRDIKIILLTVRFLFFPMKINQTFEENTRIIDPQDKAQTMKDKDGGSINL